MSLVTELLAIAFNGSVSSFVAASLADRPSLFGVFFLKKRDHARFGPVFSPSNRYFSVSSGPAGGSSFVVGRSEIIPPRALIKFGRALVFPPTLAMPVNAVAADVPFSLPAPAASPAFAAPG